MQAQAHSNVICISYNKSVVQHNTRVSTWWNWYYVFVHALEPQIMYRLQISTLCPIRMWGQKQVSQAGISNYIPQFTMGYNYLYLSEIPALSNKVNICIYMSHINKCTSHTRDAYQIILFMYMIIHVAIVIHTYVSRYNVTQFIIKYSENSNCNKKHTRGKYPLRILAAYVQKTFL